MGRHRRSSRKLGEDEVARELHAFGPHGKKKGVKRGQLGRGVPGSRTCVRHDDDPVIVVEVTTRPPDGGPTQSGSVAIPLRR